MVKEEPTDLREAPWPENYSLCCFGPRNPLRTLCQSIVNHPVFDQFIILAILVSSVCLALDVPRLDPASPLSRTLQQLNYVWTWLFFGELMLKVIAFGFCFGKTAYVKNPWNLLDLAIVTVSFLVLAAETFPALAPLKTLRVLRVLRPLRLLSRDPGMKLVITTLFKVLPAASNVFGVVMAFQLVFAILGMQLFQGRLGACTEPSIDVRELCLRRRAAGGGSPPPSTPRPTTRYEADSPSPPMLPFGRHRRRRRLSGRSGPGRRARRGRHRSPARRRDGARGGPDPAGPTPRPRPPPQAAAQGEAGRQLARSPPTARAGAAADERPRAQGRRRRRRPRRGHLGQPRRRPL